MCSSDLECMPKQNLEEQAEKYGGLEQYREYLASGFQNEQALSDVFRWYGSKEKAMEAILQSTGNTEDFAQPQEENEQIYRQFMKAKETGDALLAEEAVKRLAESYKNMFRLDNARSILLDLAKEYLQNGKLAEVTDAQFGEEIGRASCRERVSFFGF